MSTLIDPNAPTFEQKALKAIYAQNHQAYADLFGGTGNKTLKKAMEYIGQLEKSGLVYGQKEGDDMKVYLTDEGRVKIGV